MQASAFTLRAARALVLALTMGLACRGRAPDGPSVEVRMDALKAAIAASDVSRAEQAADTLENSPAEAKAAVMLAELLVTADRPDAGARLKARRVRLAARGKLVAASDVARIEGRWAGWEKNRYLDALEAFDQAVGYAERAGDQDTRRKALRGLFNMFYDLGDLRGARRCLTEASRTPNLDDRRRALLAVDRGMLADAEDQPAVARAAFEEALKLGAKAGAELAWIANLNLLTLALRSGDLAAANRLFTTVDGIFAAGEYHRRPHSRIARGRHLARLQLLRGDPRSALTTLAALAAEKPTPEEAWVLDVERGKALAALGRTAPAIAAFEQALETIEGLRGDQPDDFKSWVLAQRRAPFVHLFRMHVAAGHPVAALDVLERLQGRTFLDAFAATAAKGGEGRTSDAASRVQWLRRLYPALRTSPVTAGTVQPAASLLRGDRRLQALAYLEEDEALHIVSMAGGNVRTWRAPASLAQIRSLIARVLEDPVAPEVAELSRLLLPSEALPPAGTTLYLMPSPSLARVPFPALRVGGHFLIERHVLAQVPSLNALAALQATPARADGPVVVFADATQDLSEAAIEGREVTQALGGPPRAVLLMGPAATTTALRAVKGASVLHFAVHSGVGATGPWLGLNDRAVPASELLDHPTGANLVVLASCASAATPDPGLWGSLVASFLASGSRAVVGALWSTRDRASRELVQRFYASGGAEAPALALASAQRAWIAEKRPVRDWSAFAFFGAASPLGRPLARADRP